MISVVLSAALRVGLVFGTMYLDDARECTELRLARVTLLLRFDAGALPGHTGAVFGRCFGTGTGTAAAADALAFWLAAPLVLAGRRFRRQDF